MPDLESERRQRDWTVTQLLIQARHVERHLRHATVGVWILIVLGIICMITGIAVLVGISIGYGR